jgi:hypothetical protein
MCLYVSLEWSEASVQNIIGVLWESWSYIMLEPASCKQRNENCSNINICSYYCKSCDLLQVYSVESVDRGGKYV